MLINCSRQCTNEITITNMILLDKLAIHIAIVFMLICFCNTRGNMYTVSLSLNVGDVACGNTENKIMYISAILLSLNFTKQVIHKISIPIR